MICIQYQSILCVLLENQSYNLKYNTCLLSFIFYLTTNLYNIGSRIQKEKRFCNQKRFSSQSKKITEINRSKNIHTFLIKNCQF